MSKIKLAIETIFVASVCFFVAFWSLGVISGEDVVTEYIDITDAKYVEVYRRSWIEISTPDKLFYFKVNELRQDERDLIVARLNSTRTSVSVSYSTRFDMSLYGLMRIGQTCVATVNADDVELYSVDNYNAENLGMRIGYILLGGLVLLVGLVFIFFEQILDFFNFIDECKEKWQNRRAKNK